MASATSRSFGQNRTCFSGLGVRLTVPFGLTLFERSQVYRAFSKQVLS